jgi:hypothetical protein
VVNKAHHRFSSSFGGMPVSQLAAVPRNKKRIRTSNLGFGFVLVLALQLLLFSAPVDGRAASQEQQKQPIGSLSSVGEVYVNESLAPAELTVFSGDTLRTGQTGMATFETSGKGSFRISPHTQLVFTGSRQYIAEVKSGTVVMSSLSGPSGINLRAGNFVLVAVTQGEQSTSKIETASDGTFLVTCLEGSVGVLPLEGSNGIFLADGQSVSISTQGELSSPKAAPASTTPATTKPSAVRRKNYTGWIIVGAAGGGGVAAAAALSGRGGSKPVSPSSP